jgi:hypothetical protein
MAQPPTIYKPGKLNYVWNYLGKTLKDFAAALSPYLTNTTYKVYSALLTQTGSSDPTVIVLQDTLDAQINWYRDSAGSYYAESYGTWTLNKTTMTVGPLPDGSDGAYVQTKIDTEDQAYVIVKDIAGLTTDDALSLTFVEIRVYN